MNKNLQTIFHYHETTKHSQQRYARSLGYMDWATQPNPFREYKDTKKISLPLSTDNSTPPYSLLDADLPSAPLLKESLAQFLEFSMGIAAWKESGGSSWAVRCNASSGNLHPTETYLILPPLLEQTKTKTQLLHYRVKEHELEVLAEFETDFWETLPKESFLVGISSIAWREVWKYGERAFRYVNLDAGHAQQSIAVSAKVLGWSSTKVDITSHKELQKLMGLHEKSKFHEEEVADMLLLISPSHIESQLSIEKLLSDMPSKILGLPNRLSPSMQEWDIIPQIIEATSQDALPLANEFLSKIPREASKESKEVILKRRSVHVMDKESSHISKEEFFTLLRSVASSLDAKKSSVHLAIFVHRVEGLASGLYIFLRNSQDKEELKTLCNPLFHWKKSEFESLYLLHEHDYKLFSKTLSCSQDIASDGAFCLGMLAPFSQELLKYGTHRYKELYWECGAIGQQLYLEATSLGLSGTGIGCFLDDMMHDILELKDNHYQVLYNFTVGRGYVDSRIQTLSAYSKR